MSFFDRIVEEKIKAAMKAGEFDNLPGKGKPLALDLSPFTPEEERLAQHLLKENGVLPPWLELRQQIEQEIASLRARLAEVMRQAGNDSAQHAAAGQAALQITALNRLILRYNGQVPAPVFERSTLDIEFELKRAREQNP